MSKNLNGTITNIINIEQTPYNDSDLVYYYTHQLEMGKTLSFIKPTPSQLECLILAQKNNHAVTVSIEYGGLISSIYDHSHYINVGLPSPPQEFFSFTHGLSIIYGATFAIFTLAIYLLSK